MKPLTWDHRPSDLRAPALLCAFRGWNDAGEAATAAVSFFNSALDGRRFAWTDAEEFFDYQATRPRIRLVDGVTRAVEWPAIELFEIPVPRAPRDLVLMTGPESQPLLVLSHVDKGRAAMLMSDDGEWINGQVISVDGGITMQLSNTTG